MPFAFPTSTQSSTRTVPNTVMKKRNNDRLALETLGEIFAYTFPYDLGPLGPLSRAELLDLCLVCRVWRDAARAKHELWSGVKLRLSERDRNDIACAKAGAWLKRSAGIPKSLVVDCTVCMEMGDVGACNFKRCALGDPALAKLLLQMAMWGHLEIVCATPRCIENLAHAIETASTRKRYLFNTLDSLPIRSLSFNFRRGWNGAFASKHIFDKIPASTALALSLPRPIGQICHDVFSRYISEHLTRLSLRSYHWRFNEIGKILRQCINLAQLTLDVADGDYFVPVVLNNLRVDGISLPKLHTLRLKSLAPYSMELLDKDILRLHRLRHLDISFEIPGTEQQLFDGKAAMDAVNVYWRPFILKHAATLETFRIFDVNTHWMTLRAMMPRFPKLKHLTLEKVRFGAGLFREMGKEITGGGGCEWFPVLERLDLLKVTSMFELDHVFSYFKARRPHHCEWSQVPTGCKYGQGTSKAVVFDGPRDSIRRVDVTYRWPLAMDLVIVDPSPTTEDVSRALRREGVVVIVGPRRVSFKVISAKLAQAQDGAAQPSALCDSKSMADVARMLDSSRLV